MLDLMYVDSPLSLRMLLHLDASLSVYGMSWLEVFPSALDFVHPDLSMLLQTLLQLGSLTLLFGVAQSGSSSSMPDLIHVEVLLLLQTFMQLGFSLLTFGMTCIEPSMSVLNSAHPGSSSFPRFSCRLSATMFIFSITQLRFFSLMPDSAQPSLLLPLHIFLRIGLALSVYGLV